MHVKHNSLGISPKVHKIGVNRVISHNAGTHITSLYRTINESLSKNSIHRNFGNRRIKGMEPT